MVKNANDIWKIILLNCRERFDDIDDDEDSLNKVVCYNFFYTWTLVNDVYTVTNWRHKKCTVQCANFHSYWFKIMFLWLYRNTEQAQAIDVMIAQTKRNHTWIIKVNKFSSFFVAKCSKGNRKHVVCISFEF